MNVLGVDLGDRSAVAAGDPSTTKPTVEAWENEHKPGDPPGKRFHVFQKRISGIIGDLKAAGGLGLIGYEQVIQHKGGTAAHIYGGYQTILELEAYLFQIPIVPIHFSSIKKGATGHGDAQKVDVLVALRDRFPEIEIAGFDEADALGVWLLTCRKIEEGN